MLFHVISICDMMMLTTERFIRSSPAWLPIVTQLYVAVLWNVMIIKVFANSGYGSEFANLLNELVTYLRIDECVIPGPLVPFFQSLAAVNGPFEWIGDVLPALPDFDAVWTAADFSPSSSFARQIPVPVILLDQLAYFATRANPANVQSQYTTFEWYRNVFQQGQGTFNARVRLGPQMCGSLFTTQAQFDAAKSFWNAVFTGFTRVNGALADAPFLNYVQWLGFMSQAGTPQTSWFQHVCIVMQKYCQYFNGSVPLKSILPVGIGSVVIFGQPLTSVQTRDWVYPLAARLEAFTSARFNPLRELPDTFQVKFMHSDHEIEEQAEQYAILSHTNIDWSTIRTQNGWTAISRHDTHRGDYWNMIPFRYSNSISLKLSFAQVIASRYHQQAANRAE